MYAQEIKLPEVIISAVNYKYLNTVNEEDIDPSVQRLEQEVAFYNIKESDLYEDDYSTYMIEFYIPDGRIVAAYDSNGTIIRTIEKYASVKLPKDVRNAAFTRFPNWTLDKDAYFVTYNSSNSKAKKIYKLKLRNGNEVVRLKIDSEGNFM